MKIEVLGTGCKKCVNTAEMVRDTARDMGIEAEVRHVTDPRALLEHGVMSTPAVVIDGNVVHSGSMPAKETVEAWLRG